MGILFALGMAPIPAEEEGDPKSGKAEEGHLPTVVEEPEAGEGPKSNAGDEAGETVDV